MPESKLFFIKHKDGTKTYYRHPIHESRFNYDLEICFRNILSNAIKYPIKHRNTLAEEMLEKIFEKLMKKNKYEKMIEEERRIQE